jgi:hypothetical protein
LLIVLFIIFSDMMSVTSEQATHVDKNTAASFAHQVTRDDLLKPMAVFSWPIPEQGANKRSSTSVPSGKAYKVCGDILKSEVLVI